MNWDKVLIGALVVVALILFGGFGYMIASIDDEQAGTSVPADSGIHIDTSDDWGLHVRPVLVDGRTCYVATQGDGVGIDCPES